MAIFQYKALTQRGKRVNGYVAAGSLYEAKLKAGKDEISLTKIKEIPFKSNGTALKKKEVLGLTSELSKLLKAGLPLFEALIALEEKYQGHKTHTLILNLIEQIQEGNSLSSALSLHKKSFDDLYISMVETAEKSATLDETLEEISSLISKQLLLKKKVLSTLMYPSLLGLFSLGILSLLFFYIIPSLFELFEGRELHPFTRFVLSISAFLQKAKILFIAAFCMLLTFIGICLYSKKAKLLLSRLVLKIPIIHDLLVKLAFVRFCRSSSTLLLAGVPLLDAITLAKSIINQPVIEKAFEDARIGIMEGRRLSEELKKNSYVPNFVVRMLGIAEESGKVPSCLQHISQIYEEELEKSLDQITSLLQPLLLLFIGIIIGFVLLSVLLPLTDVSSFVMN